MPLVGALAGCPMPPWLHKHDSQSVHVAVVGLSAAVHLSNCTAQLAADAAEGGIRRPIAPSWHRVLALGQTSTFTCKATSTSIQRQCQLRYRSQCQWQRLCMRVCVFEWAWAQGGKMREERPSEYATATYHSTGSAWSIRRCWGPRRACWLMQAHGDRATQKMV
jgi:hypothetical protein